MIVKKHGNIALLDDNSVLNKALICIPEYYKNKYENSRLIENKKLELLAGLLLYEAVKSIDIDFNDWKIEKDELGKPYFPNKRDLFFNVSHSKEEVLVCVSDKNIGCDIELIDEDYEKALKRAYGISKRFFSEDENSYLMSLEEEIRVKEFYRIWTMKEAYLKAIGTGLRRELNSFSVVFDNKIVNSIDDLETGKNYIFVNIEDINNYAGTICTED